MDPAQPGTTRTPDETALRGPDKAALALLELTTTAPTFEAYVRTRATAEAAEAAVRHARKTVPKRAAPRGASDKALQRRALAQEAYERACKANAVASDAQRRVHRAMGRDALSGLIRPMLESALLGGLPAGRWVRTDDRTLGMRRRYEIDGRAAEVNFFARFDPYGLPEEVVLSVARTHCEPSADDTQYAATFRYPSMWDKLYTLWSTDRWPDTYRRWLLDTHVGHGWDAQDLAILSLVQADVSQMATHLDGVQMPTHRIIDMAVHAIGDVVAGEATYGSRHHWLRAFEGAFPAAEELIAVWLRSNGIPTEET